MTKRHPAYDTLPDWTGELAVVLGGGPSLLQEHISYLSHRRDRCKVVGLCRAYRWAPWLDWHHAGDQWWWKRHMDVLELPCFKTTEQEVTPLNIRPDQVVQIPMARRAGKPFADPRLPCHMGYDSNYQVMQLLTLAGVAEIALLGMDGRPNGHWHEGYGHRNGSDWDKIPPLHRDLRVCLDVRGVKVWNCTEHSAIDAYDFAKIEDVL